MYNHSLRRCLQTLKLNLLYWIVIPLKAVLNAFQRLSARLRHVSGEHDDSEQGQGAEEKVGAECGAGEEDRGGEGDEPIGELQSTMR